MNECGNTSGAGGGNNTGGFHSIQTSFMKGSMITESLIISCLVCVGLTLLAYLMKSLPFVFVSSIGWLICGLMIFQQTDDVLPMLLLFMFSFGQFMFIKKEAA